MLWFQGHQEIFFHKVSVCVKNFSVNMTKKTPKKCGIGAVCWVYTKYMHPQKEIRAVFQNMTSNDKMTDLLVVGREVKSVRHKLQMCVCFRHDRFPNKIIYCVKRYANHVVKEGDPTGFFDATDLTVPDQVREGDEIDPEGDDDDGDEIPDHVFHCTGRVSEDIAHVRGLGLDVDDDNDPAPENIPDNEPIPDTNQSWGTDGLDYRALGNYMNVKPNLLHGLPELAPDLDQRVLAHLFMTFSPQHSSSIQF